jgi:hypothetical protein
MHPGEGFGHLAAIRVLDTDEQNGLHEHSPVSPELQYGDEWMQWYSGTLASAPAIGATM